jgi:HD-like signal output (HDOD) protein
MKVECPSCSKVYNIPDESLKSRGKIVFKCPVCRGDIKLDLRSTENNPEKQKQDSSESCATNLTDDLKKEIAKSIKDLEPMPKVIHEARELLSNPNTTFKKIGKVIETDQAITAKVLKIANSAYYGLSGRVSSIHQAIVVMGLETLKQAIYTAGSSKLLSKTLKGYDLQPSVLWNHSLAVAFGAKIIAAKRKPTLENDAFTAGLLHDVGKLILDEYILKSKLMFEKLTKDTNSSRKAEEELFGFDHSEIAGLICEEWHLPENQTLAIRHHHDPSRSPEVGLTYILHLADHLAHKCGFGAGITEEAQEIKDYTLEILKLDEEELVPIMDEITENVDNISKSVV